MARTTETIVTLTDDIDGGKAVETVTFGLDGASYEIDLSAKNAKALRVDIEKWLEHARKAKGAQRRRGSGGGGAKSDAAEIRAWTSENGIEVPARGRIPESVREQYNQR